MELPDTDIQIFIRPDGYAVVEGMTDAGVDFVESWVRDVHSVFDAGNIVLRDSVVEDFISEARQHGMGVEQYA